MSIVIVATPGSATANSFLTYAEADAYLSVRLNAAAWTGETDDERQMAAMIEATRDVSALEYPGHRATTTQALAWPRFNAPDPDGISDYVVYGIGVVPQRMKDGTAELALEYLRAGTTDLAALDRAQGVIRKKIGPLETEWSPGGRAVGIARFPRVMAHLGPLLVNTTGQVRLVR